VSRRCAMNARASVPDVRVTVTRRAISSQLAHQRIAGRSSSRAWSLYFAWVVGASGSVLRGSLPRHSTLARGFLHDEEADMTRKVVDCRDFPSETNCTLTISGREMEVLQAASEHAVSTHGHVDGPELRKQIHTMMKDEVSASA
jgi:hypothetical protein